uniref:Ig-like domain-containing protein n=1 Tax=Strigamia maritima TaxID=126957 RepID=T1J6W4_STRMM
MTTPPLSAFAQTPTVTTPEQSIEFLQEPPDLVDFSNSTGTRIVCAASGSPTPTISWLVSDGNQVTNVTSLRQVNLDGTLVFPPFRAEDYRQDVHAVVYKCVASNVIGTIISRDVNVRAGIQLWCANIKQKLMRLLADMLSVKALP